MIIAYFKNLENGKEFSKEFYNEYDKREFLKKCKYSKKISYIGCTKVWG